MADNPLVQTRSPANNIDDIIEVIHNNDYAETDMSNFGAGTRSETNYSTTSSSMLKNDPEYAQKRKAYIKIMEQPQPKALRFRYVCEGRSAGAIPGVSSTAENKTHPTIKIMHFKGPVSVVVSCVTVEPPYRPHPHSLVGRECNKGVCTIEFNNEAMEYEFTNLGIQCIKKKDVNDALRLRESIKVDPFMTGFSHRNQPQHIDFNAVRLCFQVYLRDPNKRQSLFPLKPVVTDAIYDKKATADLLICKLSDCTSSVAGGKEIILLCDKVNKEDIKVRFFEIRDDQVGWESYADFQPSDVHKQVAISFKTPKYDNLNIENPVNVFIQLYRPSDHARSEPRPFEYLPLDSGRPYRSLKRLKNNYGLFQRILGLDCSSVGQAKEELLHHKKPALALSNNVATVNYKHEDILKQAANVASIQQTRADLVTANRKVPIASLTPTSTISSVLYPTINMKQTAVLPQQLSVDDIKSRMTANLGKNRNPISPTSMMNPGFMTKPLLSPKPMWADDASIYSDADILDEVLSQGSINDILSAVGDGMAVYEDVSLNEPYLPPQMGGDMIDLATLSDINVLPPPPTKIIGPLHSKANEGDMMYGDASYASCYSNLEFVLGRAKAAQETNTNVTNAPTNNNYFPQMHSRKDDDDEDFGIYGTPTSKPIHPDKESLLRQRGFLAGHQTDNKHNVESDLFYTPVSDITEVEEESERERERERDSQRVQEIPQTLLDLFV